MSILSGLANNFNKKEVRKIEKTVALIEALDDQMQLLSDDELKAKTEEFKTRLNNGETENDILPEAFAVVREASTRVLGMKHFHVQLIAGVALHQGRLAEQATGEGKSLTATLPAYLNALSGKGVHIVTVNDYLANRDAAWMGKLYRFLGLTVGCITHDVKGINRKNAYLADITYGTNNEFGFDYLKDNMATNIKQMVQRPLHYAIVDEVDSILIDEARTPLIISGKGMDSSELYIAADRFTKTLKKDRDFKIEEKDKQISLTEEGVSLCETRFNIDNLADPNNMELNHYINEALRANYIMKKDLDYIVKDGEVIIVDEFTGRLMYGRRFSNGLHQAIEAKEGVKIRAESKTLATITLQNYFRMYEKLAGMTGTAKTEEDEFRSIYNMDVITVPTNKPVIRTDLPDAVYAHKDAKYKAVVNKIAEIQVFPIMFLMQSTTNKKRKSLQKQADLEPLPLPPIWQVEEPISFSEVTQNSKRARLWKKKNTHLSKLPLPLVLKNQMIRACSLPEKDTMTSSPLYAKKDCLNNRRSKTSEDSLFSELNAMNPGVLITSSEEDPVDKEIQEKHNSSYRWKMI